MHFLTKSSTVARVGRPYRLCPKANVRLPVEERKRFPSVWLQYTLWWRCYIDDINSPA